MMKWMLATIVGLGAAASPIAAETWRSVGWSGTAPARYIYYVDVDSIERQGDLVTFWEQESLEETDSAGANRVFNFRRGNCRTLATQILRTRLLNGQHVIGEDEYESDWVSHEPTTMMGGGMEMICGRRDFDTGALADPDGHARAFFRAN